MPSSLLDLASGLLAGVVICSAIWGVTSSQVVSYYRTFKEDSMFLKMAVGCIWLLDTMFVILILASIYQIMFSADRSVFVPLATSLAAIILGIMQNTVQAFYALRIYMLWKSIYVPLICWVAAAYSLGASLAISALTVNKSAQQFQAIQLNFNWLFRTWFTVTAINDIVITLAMCFVFKKRQVFASRRTVRMLDKLVLWTFQNGLITTLVALLIVASFDILNAPNTSQTFIGVWLAITAIAGTLYPLTWIAMLNGRALLRSTLEDSSPGNNTFHSAPQVYVQTVVRSEDTAVPLKERHQTSPHTVGFPKESQHSLTSM